MANEIVTVNGTDYLKADYEQAQRLLKKASDGATALKRRRAEYAYNGDPEFLREGRRLNPNAQGGL